MLAYDFEIFLRFYIILSPNPLLMNTANVKDSENADRWLTVLSSCTLILDLDLDAWYDKCHMLSLILNK